MKIASDKIAHFGIGSLIATCAGLALSPSLSGSLAGACGVVIAAAAGALKEARDYGTRSGHASRADFWATALGGLAGGIVVGLVCR